MIVSTITLVSGGGAISVNENRTEVSVAKWLREGAKFRFIKT